MNPDDVIMKSILIRMINLDDVIDLWVEFFVPTITPMAFHVRVDAFSRHSHANILE